MPANSKTRQALPPTYRRPVMDETLDRLTDPGTSGVAGNSGHLDAFGNSDTLDTRAVETKAAARQHVKVRGSLADELRDAVWFLSEHGRPRVQLGEVIDEAVTEWLERQKQDHNGGEAFPRRGRLR